MTFPLAVVIFSWASVLLCYAFVAIFDVEILLPGFLTFLYCSLSLFFLVAGMAVGNVIRLTGEVIRFNRLRLMWITALIVLCSMVGAYSYFIYWSSKGVVFSLLDSESYLEINALYAEGEDDFGGILGRLYIIPILGVVWVEYLRSRGFLRSAVAIAVNLILLACLLSPRRAFLFYAIISWLGAYLIGKDRLSSKDALLAAGLGVGALIAFMYSQVALNKASDASLVEAVRPVVVYLLGSLSVMEELLSTPHFSDVAVVFNVPARIINQIFGSGFNVDLSIPFVSLPDLANTVPFQYYLFKDVGIFGMAIFSFFLGFFWVRALRLYRLTKSFFPYYCGSTVFTGMVLSVREGLFFTYLFWFLVCVSFVVAKLASARKFYWRFA